MKKREYLVQLEIKGAEAIAQERVVFIQNDAASGRLRLLITLNSEPYPLDGLTGEIAFLRPDGQVIIGSLGFDSEGAYYDLQSSELFCAGTVNISVNLYDSTSRLTCARFPIYVEKELETTDAVDASLTYPTLLEIMNSMDDLEGRAAILEESLNAGELTGKSAYEIAVQEGFPGSQSEWLDSLNGLDGKSAYELAVEEGFSGSANQWLASLKGDNGKSPIISSTGEWVIYSDSTGQYENTGIFATDGVRAGDIPAQSGMSVQGELNMLFALAPGSTQEISNYFLKDSSYAGVRLIDEAPALVKAYGENLFYPQDTYVEGMPDVTTNSLNLDRTAQVHELSSELISYTPAANGHGVSFCFPGLPAGKYYMSLIPSAPVSITLFQKKTDGTFATMNGALGSPNVKASVAVTLTAETAELYVSVMLPTNNGAKTDLTQFLLIKSDTTPVYSVPQCRTIIDTEAAQPSAMGAWPSWTVWGRAFQDTYVRMLNAYPSSL